MTKMASFMGGIVALQSTPDWPWKRGALKWRVYLRIVIGPLDVSFEAKEPKIWRGGGGFEEDRWAMKIVWQKAGWGFTIQPVIGVGWAIEDALLPTEGGE